MAHEPEKELLSYVLSEMNSLFQGDFSSDDMLNYARTLKDKMAENEKVLEQVQNNTQEQAMMGGFKASISDAVIENMETQGEMATEALSQDRVMQGLANIVYRMLKEELKYA